MKILFQGDSITDAGRSRDNDIYLGNGYPLLIKAALGYSEPNKYEFLNRGISGNRVVDVYARIKKDIINLAPDVMSILIGVNDVWHELGPDRNGVDAKKFFKIYCMLIEEIREALPNVKIMILEPFCLQGSATNENWETFDFEVKERAKMANAVAQKYALPFIELQSGFDKLSGKAEPSYWLGDGVHPTSMGHEFIKQQWIKAFENLI